MLQHACIVVFVRHNVQLHPLLQVYGMSLATLAGYASVAADVLPLVRDHTGIVTVHTRVALAIFMHPQIPTILCAVQQLLLPLLHPTSDVTSTTPARQHVHSLLVCSESSATHSNVSQQQLNSLHHCPVLPLVCDRG